VAKSGYAAPEYLDIWGMPEKVDVYSFGILLLELLTGKKPRDFVQLSEQSDLATWVCVGYFPLIGQSIVSTYASGGRVGDYQLLSFDSMVLSVQSLNPKP
jgi:serine/threonine protein kinase